MILKTSLQKLNQWLDDKFPIFLKKKRIFVVHSDNGILFSVKKKWAIKPQKDLVETNAYC